MYMWELSGYDLRKLCLSFASLYLKNHLLLLLLKTYVNCFKQMPFKSLWTLNLPSQKISVTGDLNFNCKTIEWTDSKPKSAQL